MPTLPTPSVEDPDLTDPASLDCCCEPVECEFGGVITLAFKDANIDADPYPGPDWKYSVHIFSGADLPNAPETTYALIYVNGAKTTIEMPKVTAGDIANFDGEGTPVFGAVIDWSGTDEHSWWSGWLNTGHPDDIEVVPYAPDSVPNPNPFEQHYCSDAWR